MFFDFLLLTSFLPFTFFLNTIFRFCDINRILELDESLLRAVFVGLAALFLSKFKEEFIFDSIVFGFELLGIWLPLLPMLFGKDENTVAQINACSP